VQSIQIYNKFHSYKPLILMPNFGAKSFGQTSFDWPIKIIYFPA